MKFSKDTAVKFFIILCTVYALMFPFEITYYCKNALSLCAGAVLPALFIYIVISKILSHLSLMQNTPGPLSRFLSRILGLPCVLIPCCITGLICGSPSGAVMCAEIYKKGRCTKEQAEICACLTNNCSAAFILGLVSTYMPQKRYAFLVLLSNIFACFTVYFLVQRKPFEDTPPFSSQNISKEEREPIFHTLSSVIKDSVVTSLQLCGYVTVFYVLSNVLAGRIQALFHQSVASSFVVTVIKGFFEMTGGVVSAGTLTVGNERIMLICMICAFCGVSIILQTSDVLYSCGLSPKRFILQKALCFLVCPLYMILFLLLLPTSVTVMSMENGAGIGLYDLLSILLVTLFALIGAKILRYIDKRHKNIR